MIGLASVTFRNLNIYDIVNLAAKAGIDGIEWGGDIHVPPGDLTAAKTTAKLTMDYGLKVLSYGSYYYLNKGSAFEEILQTAIELKAPNIRIWAGNLSPKDASLEYYLMMASELEMICSIAKPYGITISLEYHRGTLTENAISASKLMNLVSSDNLRTYWQPNPDISFAENCQELSLMRPSLLHIHTFHWEKNNIRFPLAAGEKDWESYINLAQLDPNKEAYILEFVKDDTIVSFRKDVKTIDAWLHQSSKN